MRQIVWIVLVVVSGCALLTTPRYATRLASLDLPVGQLQKMVVDSLPTGLRMTSPNGREFFSRYYVLDGLKYKAASDALDRFSAQVMVLGDRRPYDLEISVIREQRVQRGGGYDYRVVGHDKDQAKILAEKIHDRLTKRREDLNIIDDFKVF